MINVNLNFTAGANIAPSRIVKMGASDKLVVQSSAAADSHIGVCAQPGGAEIGERVDVTVSGMVDVECGATIARGDLLSADSSGRAIKAAAAVGTNVRMIGTAQESGVTGVLIAVNVNLGSFQG
jgi:hypothetical protein